MCGGLDVGMGMSASVLLALEFVAPAMARVRDCHDDTK